VGKRFWIVEKCFWIEKEIYLGCGEMFMDYGEMVLDYGKMFLDREEIFMLCNKESDPYGSLAPKNNTDLLEQAQSNCSMDLCNSEIMNHNLGQNQSD
jgi:hypothetical protein